MHKLYFMVDIKDFQGKLLWYDVLLHRGYTKCSPCNLWLCFVLVFRTMWSGCQSITLESAQWLIPSPCSWAPSLNYSFSSSPFVVWVLIPKKLSDVCLFVCLLEYFFYYLLGNIHHCYKTWFLAYLKMSFCYLYIGTQV